MSKIEDSVDPTTQYQIGALNKNILVTSVTFTYASNGSVILPSLSDPQMIFFQSDFVYPVDVKCEVSYTDAGAPLTVSFTNTYSLSVCHV